MPSPGRATPSPSNKPSESRVKREGGYSFSLHSDAKSDALYREELNELRQPVRLPAGVQERWTLRILHARLDSKSSCRHSGAEEA